MRRMKPLAHTCLYLILTGSVGCGGTETTSIAGSNEVFGKVDPSNRGVAGEDDRWASIALDETQRREVRTILGDMVEGPVQPLRPATYGIRFEDGPRAMINAAPRVEMAVLRGGLLPGEVRATFLDRRGRRATATIALRSPGPMASVAYDVPGVDSAADRAELTIDVQQAIEISPTDCDRDGAEAILRREIEDAGGVVQGVESIPDRYHYTVLMIDEQEVDIVIRREPPPKIVSWTVTAGIFGDDDRGKDLGRELDRALRAWGRIPEPE